MSAEALERQFSDTLTGLIGHDMPRALGVAVSGGGDSMALLTLADAWARKAGVILYVLTVNHGLRAEAGAEAAMVAQFCQRLGHAHAIAAWHWDGTGNLQAAARAARLGLIDRWRGRLDAVLMGHTRDDVAETFAMRLERGAGARGLAAMRARRVILPQPPVAGEISGECPPAGLPSGSGARSFAILRPCLDLSRAALRGYLETCGVPWVDDPSNDDPAFARVRARQALAGGVLDADAFVQTASRLRAACDALDQRAVAAWAAYGARDDATGTLRFSKAFLEVEPETGLRVLSAALCFVASAGYGPRRRPLEALWCALRAGEGGTLHGCELRPLDGSFAVVREFNALKGIRADAPRGAVWDHRWIVATDSHEGRHVQALGDAGWAQLEARVDTAPPYRVARALPSVWEGDRLVWCGALGMGAVRDILLCPMQMEGLDFAEFLLSH